MPHYPRRAIPPPDEVRILAGRMPDGLPVEIPLPNGSRVVGTVVNSAGREGTTIYIDAEGSPQRILAFYRAIARQWLERAGYAK
jgi:hypothetical protein